MNWAWRAARLANMSPLEVVHRVGEQAKRAVSRHRDQGWARFEGPEAFAPAAGLREKFVAGATPALRERIRASVAGILAGEFRIHDATWPRGQTPELFPPSIWRIDPVTGKLWPGPETYTFDIHHRHAAGYGDVKYVWDFNRLPFLQPLAAAVALWDDDAAAQAIEAAIASWTAANPPFGGVAWNSGIELAIRALSLCWTATLCHGRLSDATLARVATALRAHLFWLLRFPSLHSSANNHRVAELAAEWVIAGALPGLRRSPEIGARAREALLRETTPQIHGDGVGAEQSPTYAAFTVEMLLVADLMTSNASESLEDVLRDRLTSFIDHIGWLADDRGRVPAIGDDDGGRVLAAGGGAEEGYPASIARATATRLGISARIAPTRDPPELREAVFSAPAARAPPIGLKSFPIGGYTIAREFRADRSLRLTFDHGSLGYLSIAAHGHADALAFTLSLDGVDVFVDPGTYLYHSGGAWRRWLRSTPAHNTLSLAGESQSVMAGAFNWSRKARARLDSVSESDGEWSIAASHDGYRGRWGVDHRRWIHSRRGGLEIVDLLSTPTTATAEVGFQLGRDLAIEGEGRRWRIRHAKTDLTVEVDFSHSGDVSATTGGDVGEGGWISPAFGVRIPAPRLRWRGVLPAQGLRTRICWGA